MLTVRVSIRVIGIQVAIVSCNCEVIQTRRLVGETGVGCHTGWLSHCQYLIRWMAVPCVDLHVTCA